MRRVDRLLKLVTTLRIRRALRAQGRGDPAGDNAQLSEYRAAAHLLASLGYGLDEPIPSQPMFRRIIDGLVSDDIVSDDLVSDDAGATAEAKSKIDESLKIEDKPKVEAKPKIEAKRKPEEIAKTASQAIEMMAKLRGLSGEIDILSEALAEVLDPVLADCRAALVAILERPILASSSLPSQSLPNQSPAGRSLSAALGDAIAQKLEHQWPAQPKLQQVRRRQIDDVVVLAIEKGLIEVLSSISLPFDQARRTYDNQPALDNYEIVDGKLKLKIKRRRHSSAAADADFDLEDQETELDNEEAQPADLAGARPADDIAADADEAAGDGL